MSLPALSSDALQAHTRGEVKSGIGLRGIGSYVVSPETFPVGDCALFGVGLALLGEFHRRGKIGLLWSPIGSMGGGAWGGGVSARGLVTAACSVPVRLSYGIDGW